MPLGWVLLGLTTSMVGMLVVGGGGGQGLWLLARVVGLVVVVGRVGQGPTAAATLLLLLDGAAPSDASDARGQCLSLAACGEDINQLSTRGKVNFRRCYVQIDRPK